MPAGGWPGPEYLRLARETAYRHARSRGQSRMAEDFQSEAVLALLTNWPRLCARYGDPPSRRLVRGAVDHWIIDYCRREFGRDHRLRPHARAVSLDTGRLSDPDPEQMDEGTRSITPRADCDVEAEAIKNLGPDVAEVIDLVIDLTVERHPGHTAITTARRRRTLEWLAEGRSGEWIAAELGVDPPTVSLYRHGMFEAARRDPRVRAWRDDVREVG